MNVSLKTFLPTVTAGLLTLTACSNVDKRAEEYMTNKPYTEYEEVTQHNNTTLTQSKLDSVAYRDIFNGTRAAKDSTLVAEFNKIASNMRGYSEGDNISTRYYKICRSIIQQRATTKEFNEIKNRHSWYDGNTRTTTILQHYADDWAYRKFFTENGIMNDTIAKKCDEVSKKIRP